MQFFNWQRIALYYLQMEMENKHRAAVSRRPSTRTGHQLVYLFLRSSVTSRRTGTCRGTLHYLVSTHSWPLQTLNVLPRPVYVTAISN